MAATEDAVLDYVCQLSKDTEALRRVAIKTWDAFGGARSVIGEDILRVPLQSLLSVYEVTSEDIEAFKKNTLLTDLEPIACIGNSCINEEIDWLYQFATRDEFKPAVLEAFHPPLRVLLSPLETHPTDWKDALRMLASIAYAGLGVGLHGDVLEFRYMMGSYDESFPFWSMVPREEHERVVEDLMDTLLKNQVDKSAEITSPVARVILQEYLLLCVYVLLDPATMEALRLAVRFMHTRLAVIATQQSMRAQEELLKIWEEDTSPMEPQKRRPRTKNAKKKSKVGYLPSRPRKASGYCMHFGKYGWCTATNIQGCTHAKHPMKIPIYVPSVN